MKIHSILFLMVAMYLIKERGCMGELILFDKKKFNS